MTLIDRVTEGSQTVATKENCPPNPFLNPNPNRGGRGGEGQFSSRGNCPDTITEQLNKEHLSNYFQK